MIRGIVLYTRLLDGNLDGVYTNNHPNTQARQLWERATLIREESTENFQVYNCVYQDLDNSEIVCRLTFTITNSIITAEWFLENNTNPTFRGEGFQMNENQIAISYWSL